MLPEKAEVGRWVCEKCGTGCVAIGFPVEPYQALAALVGHCPWGCGAPVSRGFLKAKDIEMMQLDEWEGRPS